MTTTAQAVVRTQGEDSILTAPRGLLHPSNQQPGTTSRADSRERRHMENIAGWEAVREHEDPNQRRGRGRSQESVDAPVD